MTRLILAALAAAVGIGVAIWHTAARAQDFPAYLPQYDRDDLIMRASEEGHLAEVFYSNSADSSSQGFDGVMEFDGVQAHVRVRIGGEDVQFAEIIEVTPLDPQHSAFPAGPVNVLDGEEIVIQLMLPMF